MAWTPEEDARLRELRASGMTLVQIAEAMGRGKSTIGDRLRVIGDKPATAPDDSSRVKELEATVERLQEALERARKPRIRLSTSAPLSASSGDWVRVVVPDTHGNHIDEQAAAAFLADVEALRPREIVLLGDHVDCGGFLAKHHTWGYVAETSYSYDDDVRAANGFLDSLQSACPRAEYHYIEGNHEQRVEKWCVTESLRSGRDAQHLLDRLSIPAELSLDKRGIKYYRRSAFHMGLSIRGTIKLGSCYFTHGERTGKNAAKDTLGDFGGNVVFGHTHRIQMHQSENVAAGSIAAWNIGFLASRRPYWQNTRVTGWSHGYGLQFVRPSGEFLHVTVPIIDGRSLLVPLTQSVA